MKYTANYNLKKPEGTDVINIDDLNDNADIIDSELKKLNTNKVDKIPGKGLSTNDFTTTEKNKLAGIEEGANKIIINNTLTSTSTVQALSAKQGKILKDELDAHKAESVSKVIYIEEPYNQTAKTTVNLGFKPETINIKAVIRNTDYFSIGSKDVNNEYVLYQGVTAGMDVIGGRTVYFMSTSSDYLRGNVVFLNDGFEINWIAAGEIPGSGTRRLIVEAYAHKK